MIFICVGSLNNPFDRLFEYVDKLVDEGLLDGKSIIAQTGKINYKIRNYNHVEIMAKPVFEKNIEDCDLLICHAGTGCVVTASELGKKIIMVPREKELLEHVDNHQFELAKLFSSLGCGLQATNYEEIKKCVLEIPNFVPKAYKSNTKNFAQCISKDIEELLS